MERKIPSKCFDIHADGHPKESPSASNQIYKRKPVIVCGDFNCAFQPIDLAKPEANEGNAGYSMQERQKFGELLDAGFTDTFRFMHPDTKAYSWWSYRAGARQRNIGWRIDYFLISSYATDLIKAADIHPEIYGSDHCPIRLDIDL